MSEVRVCRICLDSEPSDGFIAPCKCTGTNKWVHHSCLRQWQRTVQIGAPNHPDALANECRHNVCQVCKTPFSTPSLSRAELLASLAAMDPASLGPSTILVAANIMSAPAVPAGLPRMLRVWMELQRSHWARSVYLLHSVEAGETGEEDKLIGVNLSRLITSDDGEAAYTAMRSAAGPNVRLLDARVADGSYVICNGGPCKPQRGVGLCAIASSRWAELQAASESAGGEAEGEAEEQSLRVVTGPALAGPDVVLVVGGVADVLNLKPSHAFFFWGQAEWTRTQLLGECARGSWGVGTARAEELFPFRGDLAEAHRPPEELFDALSKHPRIAYAPKNELRDQYESRFRNAPAAPPPSDATRRLIATFENLRRVMRNSE